MRYKDKFKNYSSPAEINEDCVTAADVDMDLSRLILERKLIRLPHPSGRM